MRSSFVRAVVWQTVVWKMCHQKLGSWITFRNSLKSGKMKPNPIWFMQICFRVNRVQADRIR